jgi:hypothetical protein
MISVDLLDRSIGPMRMRWAEFAYGSARNAD